MAKLSQKSTWGGLLTLVSIFGGQWLSPEVAQNVMIAGPAIGGILASFLD